MRSTDIHAHLAPQCLRRAVDAGGDWYGVRYHTTEKTTSFTRDGKVGIIVEDTLITTTLIFGGMMENFGSEGTHRSRGLARFAMGRLERGWQV